MGQRSIGLWFFILMFLMPIKGFTLVDLKNANYAESWVDINLSGPGYDLRVMRSYNSRTLHNGIFGFGWCSDFETALEVSPEGTLLLVECGAGQQTTYQLPTLGPKEVDAAVAEIMKKVQTDKTLSAPKAQAELQQKLRQDAFTRNQYAIRYGIKTQIKEKQKYLANGLGPDYIIKEDGLYVRNNPSGGVQKFSLKGQLTKSFDRNGNFLTFNYEGPRIKEVVDNLGRKLGFTYFENGKVKSISGPANIRADYKYKNQNDLAWARNAAGKEYSFDYDDLHNMTRVDFPDKTFRAMKYDKNRDWITSFRDVNGCEDKFEYIPSKDHPFDHYTSTLSRTCEKRVTYTASYEFWFEKTKNGTDTFLARSRTIENGSVADVAYNEKGKPLSVNKDKFLTKFTYNKEGLLDSKVAPDGTVTKMAYENRFRKVSKLIQGKRATLFSYDEKGNLAKAANSEGVEVTLKYDEKGRIVALKDQAKRKVNIQYDERFNKPSVIEREGVGKLQVSYKESGELDKVTPAGTAVAVQVASAFNNLLELIQPAGVSLSF